MVDSYLKLDSFNSTPRTRFDLLISSYRNIKIVLKMFEM